MPDDRAEWFEAQVRAAIARRDLLHPGERVVIAVSGGPDSLALLYALHALRSDLALDLHVAHLNHGLRAEAAEDARFVAGTAESLGLPCTVESADVRAVKAATGFSLEHAARRERYRFLGRVATVAGAGKVATAHTADDNVETLLINLLRGSGTDGLAGIPPMRPLAETPPGKGAEQGSRSTPGRPGPLPLFVVRPLIDLWRADVEAYCGALGLQPRLDASNLSREFLRNRVRLDLIPFLREHFGSEVPANLQRLTRIARPEVEHLARVAQDVLDSLACAVPGGMALPAGELARLDPAIGRRVVRGALRVAGVPATEIGFREVVRVLAAASGEGEAAFDLPGPVHVRRDAGRVLLLAGPPPPARAFREQTLAVPGRAAAPGGGSVEAEWRDVPAGYEPPRTPRAAEAFLDASAVSLPLAVRARRPGDRFVSLGMAGRKSLHRLFIDARVPAGERDSVPVVADGDGILWVAGLAVAHRARVTPATRRVLHLRWVSAGVRRAGVE